MCEPPRAAYIHVPFCRHRCGYCNFTLVAGRDDLIGDYLRAIELELAATAKRRAKSTRSTSAAARRRISRRSNFGSWRRPCCSGIRLADGYEWTVEANPADVDPAMIETLAALGVTRLSLGGQSFRDREAAAAWSAITRRPTFERAVAAGATRRDAGCRSI